MTQTVLVLAPMPAYPTSAGNRRRLLTTCESLQREGFAVDLATFAHEDQIYRRFGQHPPTDSAAMAETFQRTFLIEPSAAIPLKTRSRCFGIDDWCPDEVGDFVAWYFSQYPDTAAIVVNYVFLSRCLERVPVGVLKLIDTHDRFADRQQQYRPFRAEPNFFYTDQAGEAAGLARADIVLAIQSEEAAYFRGLTDRTVHLLPPRFLVRRPFSAPRRLERIGFIGHGNDPNLFSISKFAHAWADGWVPGRPELVIAGEICGSLGGFRAPGVRLDGYVARLEDFYDGVDLVVAPMLMGSGLKMKVAEALSFGRPVIGTAIGFEGFDPAIPEHRGTRVEDVKAQVLALAGDADGLAALTRACADLFARYNALSQAAEDGLVALIRERSSAGPLSYGERDRVRGVDYPEEAGPSPQPSTHRRGRPRATTNGVLTLTVEQSLRSLERENLEGGILVATERSADEGDPYAPARRRWFARPRAAAEAQTDGPTGLAGAQLALSPEWVRDRRLPSELREALAGLVAAVRLDWTAQARFVGMGAGGLTIACPMPSFLLAGGRPSAAFLIGHAVCELGVATVEPLQSAQGLHFEGLSRDDLTPVPAAVTFDYPAERRPEGSRVLFLTDDLIGLVTLIDAQTPKDPW